VRPSPAANQPIDADAGEQADRDGHGVEVREPVVGIEQRDQDQAAESAGNRRGCNLSRNPARTSGAAMRVGEMPSAAWTGRHQEEMLATITQGFRAPKVRFRISYAPIPMAPLKRLVASVLLGCGVLLVFTGFSSALGFTPLGIVASLAAIATLMYAGAAWFPAAPASAPIREPLLVFDRHCRIVGGPAAGEALASRFPEILRPEIERRCAAALNGTSARFPCLQNGRMVIYDALPVRAADGEVVYGILLTGSVESMPAAASA
jgi:hypothetical protein